MTSGYLQEEPDAGKPPVRICEGKSRKAELLDFIVTHRVGADRPNLGLRTDLCWGISPLSPMAMVRPKGFGIRLAGLAKKGILKAA